MHEFRPVEGPSKGRAALAIVVLLGTLVPVGVLGALWVGGRSASAVALPPLDKGPLLVLIAVLLPVLLVGDAMLIALAILGPKRMRYVVGDGALEVRTLFGRGSWSLAGATAGSYVPGRMWRVGGTAMPGYFTGRYREGGKGARVYATDVRAPMILVDCAGTRILLNPRNRDGFLAALHAEGASVEHPAG